ncbi:uncharacterized protein LOC131012679 [Salvia miltiorrhiza]|uniref:uncharacterized protein LOC131012679 n=1 Tax=Salvia miltiorrhiza TaxID=226208 RepID=UPI0025ABC7D0|nr:uncharacterized protein LOC131012679 [Salvia miltiorrhiza]
MSQESHVEYIKDTIGSSFEDSLSSDDDKPISEIFRGKKKICSIVLSDDSRNDSLNCVVDSAERGNIGKIKRRFVSKRKKVVHFDLSDEDSEDVDTPENFDDAHLDMPLSDEFVARATDGKIVEDSHMQSCLPLAGTLYQEKQDLVEETSKKTKITQAKDKQVTKAKKAKKMKSNSISDPSHQLTEVVVEHNKGKRVPQTPTLKSRSGRTIRRRILD